MKHFFLSALILLIPAFTFAQTNFRKGLVVTNQGDTLRGFIDYKEWIKNPKSIVFKTTPTQKEEQELTPATSNYFAIENLEAYESFSGRVSADRADFKDVPTAIDTSKIEIQAFLKILNAGEYVTLYMLADNLKIRFFLKEKNGGAIQELGFHRYIDPKRDDKIRASKIYMGQLWVLAQKYNTGTPALKKQIELSDYISTDLTKIVRVINKESKKKIAGQESKSYYRFFAGAGLNRSITSVKGIHDLVHPTTINKSSVLPKITIGIDKFFNPHVKRFIIRGEFSFTKTQQKMEREDGDLYVRQTFNQNIVSIFPHLIFNVYNQENLKAFIGSGLSGSLVSYSNNKYLHELRFSNGAVYRIYGDNYYKMDTFWYLVPVKAGVTINNFELSAIYYPPINFSKYHAFNFETKSVHVQLNYLFNK